MLWLSLAVVVLFAAIHLFAGRLRFIRMVPRSRWLSAAGGVSVAYVFVHLLPEAEHFSERVESVAALDLIGRPIYVLALLGVVTFYGLERWVIRNRPDGGDGRRDGRNEGEESTPKGVFWLHIGSFGLYNILICYLLVREAEYKWSELILYAVALGFHFVVNDFGLREHHRDLYQAYGRWILAVAALGGWLAGWLVPLHPAIAASLFGFLCGAIVLNVLKEELPAERESRFWAFAVGAAAFTTLLLSLPTSDPGESHADGATVSER